MANNYQALLYYGIEENETECSIFHSFRVEDPAQEHDDDAIAKDLASQLDCEPDDDNFQCRSMYVELPSSLIQRIQKQAVEEYLAKGAEHLVREHAHLALQIAQILDERNYQEDIYGRIEQNPDIGPDDIPEEDIPAIARRFKDIVSKNESYFESYWLSADAAIEEYLKRKQGGACPVGRLDFLSSTGKVRESIDYYSETEFIADLTVELDYGTPLCVVLYQNAEGKTISRDFLKELDCLPKSVTEEPAPGVPATEETE